MIVLVTGGAGYIGSHICLELINQGYDVVSLDNYSNSDEQQLKIIERKTNSHIIKFFGDVTCPNIIKKIALDFPFGAVIHLAGVKSVPESEINPLQYYKTNVFGTVNLLNSIDSNYCKKFIFSSSATVYGNPNYLPMDEFHELSPQNVYGRSKAYSERIIQDFSNSQNNNFKAVSLRYFNPIGASPKCNIGEKSKHTTNVMPMLLLAASKQIQFLEIFGNNYNTKDGTPGRDYVHVTDLAKAHVKAINYDKKSYEVFNIGTGKPHTVMDLISIFEKVNKVKVPFKIIDNRKGDVPIYFASIEKAKIQLDWESTFDIEDMCRDAWKWHNLNKNITND